MSVSSDPRLLSAIRATTAREERRFIEARIATAQQKGG